MPSRLGRSVRWPDRRQASQAAGLLRTLEACGVEGGEEVALLAQAREAAAALLERGAGERAGRELAVLIGRLEREPAPRAARTSPPSAPPPAPHPRRSPQAVWTPASHRTRWVAAGLAVLLLVAVVGALIVTARYPRSRPLAIVPHPRPAASPQPSPARPAPAPLPNPTGPRPVPALAPSC